MTKPMIYQYEAIIFDLDGTLVDTKQFPLRASQMLFKRLGLTSEVRFQQYLRALVTDYFRQIDEVVGGAPYKRPFEIIKHAVETGLNTVGITPNDELLNSAAQDFFQLHLELPELYPGVSQLLTSLNEQGIRLGVITNSFENHLDSILCRLDIRDCFEVLVDAGVVNTYKPNPRPFVYALNVLSVNRESAIVVGDEFYADIVGAHNAGVDSIWVNIRGNSLDEYLNKYGLEVTPKAMVSAIAEIQHL